MEGQPGRPFGVLDAMVLVAATAIGLALLRATRLTSEIDRLLIRWALGAWDRGIVVCEATLLLSPVLTMWSLAVVLLTLGPDRPRRFTAQPGFVAGVAATMGIALGLFFLIVEGGGTQGHSGWVELAACATGYATAASWLTLALAGVWRTRAHWLDRLGRILGVLWIGMGLTGMILIALQNQ